MRFSSDDGDFEEDEIIMINEALARQAIQTPATNEIQFGPEMLVDQMIGMLRQYYMVTTSVHPLTDEMVTRVSTLDSNMIDELVDMLILEFDTKTLLKAYALSVMDEEALAKEFQYLEYGCLTIKGMLKIVQNSINDFLHGRVTKDILDQEQEVRERIEFLHVIQGVVPMCLELMRLRKVELKEAMAVTA